VLSFVFGGGQHYDVILVALVALRFGKNFPAVFWRRAAGETCGAKWICNL